MRKKYHVYANCLELIWGQGDIFGAIGVMALPRHYKSICESFIPTWVEAFPHESLASLGVVTIFVSQIKDAGNTFYYDFIIYLFSWSFASKIALEPTFHLSSSSTPQNWTALLLHNAQYPMIQ